MTYFDGTYMSSSTSAPTTSPHFEEYKRWRDSMRILAQVIQGSLYDVRLPDAR